VVILKKKQLLVSSILIIILINLLPFFVIPIGNQNVNNSFTPKNSSTDNNEYLPYFDNFPTIIPTLMKDMQKEGITHYKELIVNLTSFYPYRSWKSSNNRLATYWFEIQLKKFTNNQIIPLPGFSSFIIGNYQNVVGVLPSSVPSNTAIIIGGHFDSVPPSPGADDNASGACAVLEIARLITKLNLTLTTNIIFCGFNAEEVGLLGSEELAGYLASADVYEVLLMVNFDMIINGKNSLTITYDSNLYYEQGYYWALLLSAISNNYGLSVFSIRASEDVAAWQASDQYYFSAYRFPALYIAEKEFSPFYHSNDDIWYAEGYNYTQGYEALSAVAAMITYYDEVNKRQGLHFQITNNQEYFRYELVSLQEAIFTIRTWSDIVYTEPMFTITGEIEEYSNSSIIKNNYHYWSGVLKPGNYTVEFINTVDPLTIIVTIGPDEDYTSIPDIWEENFPSLDYYWRDDDNDGISNLEEFYYNLNPKNNDTDFDTWNDQEELLLGYNPNDRAHHPIRTETSDISTTTEHSSITTSTNVSSFLFLSPIIGILVTLIKREVSYKKN
jgi:hypothetical protein